MEDIPLSELNEVQEQEVRDLLGPFSAMWPEDIGQIKEIEHHIDLVPDAWPQRQQPYRAGPKKRKIIEEHVKELLEAEVMEPAQSLWAAPVVILYQPNKIRFITDYRRLHNLTVKDRYPLPRMEDYLESLGRPNWFKTLDCNCGYWQVPIAE